MARSAPLTVQELTELPLSFPIWPTVGRAFDLGRDSTYRLAREGRLPCQVLTLGGQLRVTRAALLTALGLDPDMRTAALPGTADATTQPEPHQEFRSTK